MRLLIAAMALSLPLSAAASAPDCGVAGKYVGEWRKADTQAPEFVLEVTCISSTKARFASAAQSPVTREPFEVVVSPSPQHPGVFEFDIPGDLIPKNGSAMPANGMLTYAFMPSDPTQMEAFAGKKM